jgi:ribonuclease HII
VALGWTIEAGFTGLVFGVDEVGRGPWAGPVTAAAVCLSGAPVPPGLADSKALSASARTAAARRLDPARVAIAEATVDEIDRLNIRAATLLAMARAIAALAESLGPPAVVLVDGNARPDTPYPCDLHVGGDATVASIAAASIAAKVHRDARMAALAEIHSGYGWETNRGYGTAFHAAALARLGPTEQHRRSFAPVRNQLAG